MSGLEACREPSDDVLRDFIATTRPWGRVPVPLSPELSAAFWAVTLANLLAAGWAVTVLAAGWRCAGFLCALSTLGGRPALLLAVTVVCVLTMLVLAAVTGGMARAGGGQLAALMLTFAVGVGAVLGALLALALVALAITVLAGVLFALLERS